MASSKMTQEKLDFFFPFVFILVTLASPVSVPDGGLVADVCLYAEIIDLWNLSSILKTLRINLSSKGENNLFSFFFFFWKRKEKNTTTQTLFYYDPKSLQELTSTDFPLIIKFHCYSTENPD